MERAKGLYSLAPARLTLRVLLRRLLLGLPKASLRTNNERVLIPLRKITSTRWKWSGRRDSNPRHQPWQGCTLPTELRPHKLTTTSVEDRCNGVNGVISPVGITNGLRSHNDSCVSVGFTGGRKNGTRSGTHAIHLKTALKGNCEVGKKMPQWGLTSKPLK